MIDESAKTALMAVSPEVLGGQAEPWFDAVISAAQEDGTVLGWDDFLRRLKESASSFGQAVDLFEQGMRDDSSAWPNIAQQLINEGASQLASQYEQAWTDQLADPGADEVDVAAAWEELVAEGGDWSAWDGSDEGWAQWRDWFYSVAATHGDAVEAGAHEQLDWMDPLPVADKIAALRERGFTVPDPAADEAAGAAPTGLAPDITQLVTDNVAPRDEQEVLDLLSQFKSAGLTDEQIKEALAEAS